VKRATSSRLPHGVRDHLPVAAARRRALVAALLGEFERWGYRPVITPLYEYDAVLARGMGDAATRAMRFVEPSSGEILALRPDLTPQVARLVATRLHDEPGPIRLCYEGSVVRGGEELYQAGVELIDAPRGGGDLEAVTLAAAALRAAGAGEIALDLGHAAVVRAALEGLGLDDEDDSALHAALQKKDRAEVERLAARAKLPAARKKLVAQLPSLYGGVEVLARAKKLIGGEAARAVRELEQLAARLEQLHPDLAISVDLGEVRGFRYYTGTRFALYAPGAAGALVQGGRYDGVVERYGRAARATGFAVDVEALTELLRREAAPAAPHGILVAGDAVRAGRLAQSLRARGLAVVLDLDERVATDQVLEARAKQRGLGVVLLAEKRALRWFGQKNGQELQGSGDEPKALAALAPQGTTR
jgi:ATP phosphoribosyltransferase regulatory subunit